jgi:hypothetical protein
VVANLVLVSNIHLCLFGSVGILMDNTWNANVTGGLVKISWEKLSPLLGRS